MGSYTKEFKKNVADDFESGLYAKMEIAKKYGLSRITLDQWIKKGDWSTGKVIVIAVKKTVKEIKRERKNKQIEVLKSKQIKASKKNKEARRKIKENLSTKRSPLTISEPTETVSKQAKNEVAEAVADVLSEFCVRYIKDADSLNEAVRLSLESHSGDLKFFNEQDKKLQEEKNNPTLALLGPVKIKENRKEIVDNERALVFKIGLFGSSQKSYKDVAQTLKSNFEGVRLALGLSNNQEIKGKVNLIDISPVETDEEFIKSVEYDKKGK